MKDLPHVFANKIKKVNNNDKVFYSSNSRSYDNKLDNLTMMDKINNIFKSPKYMYKADVEITLDNKIVIKRIIGKKDGNLITIENELIPIDKIRDIKIM